MNKNKEKLRKYKVSLRDSEKKETTENIKNLIEIYGSFHIDTFAERVCKIDNCPELRSEAENYLKKINELRDIFEEVSKKYGFKSLRRCENGQAYA